MASSILSSTPTDATHNWSTRNERTCSRRWAQLVRDAYRHGLRASELTDLRRDQIDLARATLHVRRLKQGSPSTHSVLGEELRMLRRLRREQEPKSPFVVESRPQRSIASRHRKAVWANREALASGFAAQYVSKQLPPLAA
jgi:integrase